MQPSSDVTTSVDATSGSKWTPAPSEKASGSHMQRSSRGDHLMRCLLQYNARIVTLACMLVTDTLLKDALSAGHPLRMLKPHRHPSKRVPCVADVVPLRMLPPMQILIHVGGGVRVIGGHIIGPQVTPAPNERIPRCEPQALVVTAAVAQKPVLKACRTARRNEEEAEYGAGTGVQTFSCGGERARCTCRKSPGRRRASACCPP